MKRFCRAESKMIGLILILGLLVFTFPVNAQRSQWRTENVISYTFGNNWDLSPIDIPKGWRHEKSTDTVVIAVIDSGIQAANSEQNIWINSDEVANDGRDNDNNGFVNDLRGWDFYEKDNNPREGCINCHGTFLASIITSPFHSDKEKTNIAREIKIMDLRILDEYGLFLRSEWDNLVKAIDYAVQNGADIINLSLSMQASSSVEALGPARKGKQKQLRFPSKVSEALEGAENAGVLIIAAAGNNSEKAVYWEQQKGVLTVAALNKEMQLADFSNYGPAIDLAAPGVNVFKEVESKYCKVSGSGTSFAAAYVTRVAGLLLALNPDLSMDKLREILIKSARDVGKPGWDSKTGAGMIDGLSALKLLKQQN